MQRTQIYLTDREKEGIDRIIQLNGGGTLADIIRRAIDDYIIKYNSPVITNNTFQLSFKDSNEKVYHCDVDQFYCTGIPYQFDDAIKLAKEHGAESLGTVGYFRDRDGFLRDSGQIKKFI